MVATVPLERGLAPADTALLRRLGRVAQDEGVALYLVGGSVRDALQGVTVHDLDLVSETAAVGIADALIRAVGGSVIASSSFGTLKLELAGRLVDLATARSESYARPGALPTVVLADHAPVTVRDDLSRRDFTVNAMAAALWPSGWGELVDPWGGVSDLARRSIRVLHAASFRDDATRTIRAVRYAHRLDFRVERRTLSWLRRDQRYLAAISPARVHRELGRVLAERRPVGTLRRLHRMGLLGALDASLGSPEVDRALRRIRRPLEPAALVGALAYAAAAPEVPGMAQRIGLTAAERRVVRDVQWLRAQEPGLGAEGMLPHQAVEQLERCSPHAVAAVAAVTPLQRVRVLLRRYLVRWSHLRPPLDGAELRQLGVPAGPVMGRVLKDLRDARLDGRLRSRRSAVARVRMLVRGGLEEAP